MGMRQMIAVIGDSANLPSIRLHEALGFERALAGGRLPSMGGSAPMAVPDAMGMGMGGLGPAQPLDFAAMETMQ